MGKPAKSILRSDQFQRPVSLSPTISRVLMMLTRAIADYMRYYNQTAKPPKWSYTVEKLERKLAHA